MCVYVYTCLVVCQNPPISSRYVGALEGVMLVFKENDGRSYTRRVQWLEGEDHWIIGLISYWMYFYLGVGGGEVKKAHGQI